MRLPRLLTEAYLKIGLAGTASVNSADVMAGTITPRGFDIPGGLKGRPMVIA